MNIELSNESGVSVDEAGLISVAEYAMQHMGGWIFLVQQMFSPFLWMR